VSVQKIKNLILLILALAVVFLTLLVVPTKTAQAREETALHDRLETLFSENGVQLDGSALPQSLRLYTISLDGIPQAAGSAVSVLLGSSAEVQDDTVRYSSVYTSARGACSVTANGAFSASLDGSLAYSDPVAGTKKLLRSMGFTAAAVSEAARKSAGVYAVTATQQILGVPVFSDGLTFTYTNGALESVEGVFFPGSTFTRVSDSASISCADALVELLASRDSLGWVGSRITLVQQGYEHFDTASAAVRLVPVWRIDTDTGSFVVNGMTREITAVQSAE
jgi:hypothetical protein